jgi:hypothetical protein
LEINCIGHHGGIAGGLQGGHTSINGFTSHNQCVGIRVGGTSDRVWGPHYADVEGSITWNMGCEGTNSLVDWTAAPSQASCFQIGDGGLMWVDGGYSDGNYSPYNANGTATLFVRNGRHGGSNVTAAFPNPTTGSSVVRY